jgi:hypothetical protein
LAPRVSVGLVLCLLSSESAVFCSLLQAYPAHRTASRPSASPAWWSPRTRMSTFMVESPGSPAAAVRSACWFRCVLLCIEPASDCSHYAIGLGRSRLPALFCVGQPPLLLSHAIGLAFWQMSSRAPISGSPTGPRVPAARATLAPSASVTSSLPHSGWL